MRLTIVAATGGVGRQLVDQALAAGHEVTAVARSPQKLAGTKARVVGLDLATASVSDLVPLVQNADAVLSGLGARSTAEVGIALVGTQAIVSAMKAAGARRILVVSAAPISTVPSPGRPHPPARDPGEGFFMRNLLSPMIKRILRAHYADLAKMEDVLRASELDWTVVRPPRLNDRAARHRYRVAKEQNLRGGLSVSRADVAHYMLSALADRTTFQQCMGIAD